MSMQVESVADLSRARAAAAGPCIAIQIGMTRLATRYFACAVLEAVFLAELRRGRGGLVIFRSCPAVFRGRRPRASVHRLAPAAFLPPRALPPARDFDARVPAVAAPARRARGSSPFFPSRVVQYSQARAIGRGVS